MSKRYSNFDYLRGMAIIGVILIHITSPLTEEGDIWGILFNQISRFAVPVFFLLSGWGLVVARSYEKSNSYLDFISKRLTKIIPPYFLWNIIYFLYINLSLVLTGNDMRSIFDFLSGLFLGTNYGHFYFIPLIVLLYICYPFLLKVGKNTFGMFFILIITILSQMADQITGIELFNAPQNIFNWIFYFIFGIWLADNFEEKANKIVNHRKKIIILFALSLLIILGESFYSAAFDGMGGVITTTMRPTVIMYSILYIFIFIGFNIRSSRLQGLLNIYSKYSFDIYLSHSLFISILSNVARLLDIQVNSFMYILAMFIVVSALSILLAVLQRKISNYIQKRVLSERESHQT